MEVTTSSHFEIVIEGNVYILEDEVNLGENNSVVYPGSFGGRVSLSTSDVLPITIEEVGDILRNAHAQYSLVQTVGDIIDHHNGWKQFVKENNENIFYENDIFVTGHVSEDVLRAINKNIEDGKEILENLSSCNTPFNANKKAAEILVKET